MLALDGGYSVQLHSHGYVVCLASTVSGRALLTAFALCSVLLLLLLSAKWVALSAYLVSLAFAVDKVTAQLP